MKENKDRLFIGVILILLIILGLAAYFIYNKDKQIKQTSATSYDMAFNELVGYVQNIENFLAKATISSDSTHGAET